MRYEHLVYAHLATIVPAMGIGTALLLKPKGGASHRQLGRVYLSLMLATALIALFLPAKLGPSLFGHFGAIHLLCLLTVYAVPSAYLAARRGEIPRHRRIMRQLYIGGIVIAGVFAFSPGRLLHTWIWG